MTQKAAKVSTELLDQLIKREFPKNIELVASKLEQVNSDSKAGQRRISAAILKLANRELNALDSLIEKANYDSRDILSEAEYPRISDEGFIGIETRTDSENLELHSADWNEYSNWLNQSN